MLLQVPSSLGVLPSQSFGETSHDSCLHLSAAAGGKTNLGGDRGALAFPGVACLTTLDFEKSRAFFQHPARSVGALDRAPQVLEPRSRFDNERLTGKQLLSIPWSGVISRCDSCLYLPWLAGAD